MDEPLAKNNAEKLLHNHTISLSSLEDNAFALRLNLLSKTSPKKNKNATVSCE